MDNLEKFILDHKEDFVEKRNPENGWEELRNKLNPRKNDWSVLWKVAAVLFFVSTIGLMVPNIYEKESGQIGKSSSTSSIEEYFVQTIDFKRSEYLALADEAESEELLQDLAELDSAYSNLNSSYNQLGQVELLEAMLENLQLRVYILNEQIEILKNGSKDNEEVFYSS